MGAIVRHIESFGWTIALGKNVLSLPHRLKLLGSMLDTASMAFGIPTAQRGRLLAAARYVFDRGGRVAARKVCELVGKTFPVLLALGLVCRPQSRYLLLTVKPAAQTGDYSGPIMVTGKALGEVGPF